MLRQTLLVLLLAACGCSEDPHRQVVYEQPKMAPAAESKDLSIPQWNPTKAEPENGPKIINFGRIRPDVDLTFDGSILVRGLSMQMFAPIANVDLRRFDPRGTPVIQAQGRATATVEEGRLVYKVTVRAPPKPGRYDVRLVVGDPRGGKPFAAVVAEGEVE